MLLWERMYSIASMADSFITSPRFPVSVSLPSLPAQAGLNEHYLAANRRPCKAGNYSGIVITLIFLAGVGTGAQQFLQIVGFDSLTAEITVSSILIGNLPAYFTDFLFQLPYA